GTVSPGKAAHHYFHSRVDFSPDQLAVREESLMATRENQTLQIALMVFALLVVMLAVTTYIGFKQASDRSKELADVQTRLRDAEKGARDAETEAIRYKSMMGFKDNDTLEQIDVMYRGREGDDGPAQQGDMQKYASNLPAEEQTYRGALERLYSELRAVSQREAEALSREKETKAHLANVQKDAQKQLDAYKRNKDEIERDANSKAAKFDEERTRFEQNMGKMSQQIDEQRKKIAASIASAQEEKKKLEDQIARLQRQLFRVSQEKKELVDETFDVADGHISHVHQGSRGVWIGLGADDGLTPRVTFSVYDADEINAASAAKKGSIEVTRVLGSHMAEARILSDTPANPIVHGDQIYSPIWHRGRHESFALAGFFDIDGDGESDLERLHSLIQVNGGIVDAEIGPDGVIKGKLTVNTRYLVLGDEPKISESEGITAVKKAVAAYSEMSRQAENLGVEKISIDEFLDRMGWHPADRTVALGRGADPNDFPARPEAGAPPAPQRGRDGRFRKRFPPRVHSDK
ncbi:MAG: hypothetical protein ACC645_07565, partial [Pirellulales bacterium]